MIPITLKIKSDPRVAEKFDTYPAHTKPLIEFLRNLIIKTAEDCEKITAVEETLKWGEPSYLTKKGSTIRIDWKAKHQTSTPFISNAPANWSRPFGRFTAIHSPTKTTGQFCST